MQNKKLLLIGGAGFIGSLATNYFLRDWPGYEIIVADNLYKSGDQMLQFIPHPNFTFLKCDITVEDQVRKLFERENIAGVVLLSGIVGLPSCEQMPILARAVNVDGWKYVSKYIPKNIPYVVCSTGSVYGAVLDGLCKEEGTPTEPLSIYGKTKLEGEKIALDAGAIALRFATAAGVSPAIRLNLLPNQFCYDGYVNRVINIFQPEAKRSFIDTRDFVRSLSFFIYNFSSTKHYIYNVGQAANNITKLKLGEMVKAKTGCKLNIIEGLTDPDCRDYEISYDRLAAEGFECLYTMEETIDNILKSIPLLTPNVKYN